MKKEITMSDLAVFDHAFAGKHANLVAMNAVTSSGVNQAAKNVYAPRNNHNAFSVEVDAGKVCNQKQSGRCWMFASYNVMRLQVMEKLNLEDFELSQSYPLFWDKLEKSNYFLENMIATIDEPVDGRVVSYLLRDPIGDGGQWDMFRSLTAKYGVVPKDVMPETAVSSMTREMNSYLTKKLREYASVLRRRHESGEGVEELRAAKDEMMKTIYRILCICLGQPPMRFTWETRDKDNNFVRVSGITPQEFFEQYVGWDLDDYVTVINAPTADKPFGKTYTVQYLGNVAGGRYPVKYLNLHMDELRDITIRMLKDNHPVWFGSDVGQFSDRKGGYLTMDALQPGLLFDTVFGMTKADRLNYGDSMMTHAMVITGVDLDEEGRPIRWKVENSWGDEVGHKGYFIMDDAWFGEFSYQILLHRRYLTKEQAEAFDQEPVVLKPWDPMGSLAL
ncbi:MAG: C1 family peptidase [Lachnospiraceae bacterium]|nr:C1 family peptidase [Lachnospiraceae bacterium]